MLKLMSFINKEMNQQADFEKIEQETKNKVKEVFFDGKILKDGADDPTIRPNIFLAYYIYPELLDKNEWETVFDNSLKKLWFNWGGLSTIDKSSPLFCENYTGEDNKSYHRGDSWFFVNNIAAICLNDLNEEKYRKYVDKIIEASTKDMLYLGISGRPSELSSAAKLEAKASLCQLWSAATYIEIMQALHEKKKKKTDEIKFEVR
jgi:hypothetical protein